MRACERVNVDTNNINVIDLRVQNIVLEPKKKQSKKNRFEPNLAKSICVISFSLSLTRINTCVLYYAYMRAITHTYEIPYGNWNAGVCCNYAITWFINAKQIIFGQPQFTIKINLKCKKSTIHITCSRIDLVMLAYALLFCANDWKYNIYRNPPAHCKFFDGVVEKVYGKLDTRDIVKRRSRRGF